MTAGQILRLYVPQTAKRHGALLYEWLLETGRRFGIPGGTAVRAIAGYGRHGRLHEEHFFELAAELPVVVEFFADEAAIARLLEELRVQGVSLFYIRCAAEAGTTAE